MEENFNIKTDETNINNKKLKIKALVLTSVGIIFFVLSCIESIQKDELFISGGINNFLITLFLIIIGFVFFVIGITLFFDIIKNKFFNKN